MRPAALWLMIRPTAAGLTSATLPVVTFAVITLAVLSSSVIALLFWRAPDGEFGGYKLLAVALVGLLVVPLGTLAASAARLSARRRDERLSTLRLLGAPAGWVRGSAVAEASLLAALGIGLGIVLHLATAPLLTFFPVQGGTPGLDQVWLPRWAVAGVAFAILGVGVLCSVTGLRRVVISPLGAARRAEAPKPLRWIRVLVAVAVLGGAVAMMQLVSPGWGTTAIAAAIVLAVIAVMAVLGLVGPFVVGRLAARRLRRAERASDIIASRGVLESPRAAWRQVSGIALVSFVVVPTVSMLGYVDLIERSGTVIDPAARQVLVDIRTVILAVVALSFVLAACSVAITQAAAILERRDLYVSLDRIGMPLAEMARARRQAILAPLRVASVGSALASAALFAWLVVIAVTSAPLFALAIVVIVAGGELLVRLGLRATVPVLKGVLAHPDRAL